MPPERVAKAERSTGDAAPESTTTDDAPLKPAVAPVVELKKPTVDVHLDSDELNMVKYEIAKAEYHGWFEVWLAKKELEDGRDAELSGMSPQAIISRPPASPGSRRSSRGIRIRSPQMRRVCCWPESPSMIAIARRLRSCPSASRPKRGTFSQRISTGTARRIARHRIPLDPTICLDRPARRRQTAMCRVSREVPAPRDRLATFMYVDIRGKTEPTCRPIIDDDRVVDVDSLIKVPCAAASIAASTTPMAPPHAESGSCRRSDSSWPSTSG